MTRATTLAITFLLCLPFLPFLPGCASQHAHQSHQSYLEAAMQDRPMFRLTTHPGEAVTMTGIASLELYYPGHEPRPFVDTTAQAWAPVVSNVLGSAIPVLGMWGTVYSMGKTMQRMAPLFGDGNTSVQQSSVGGQQDLRLASPDSTHPPLVVDPLVVSPQVVQQPAPVIVDPVIVDPVVVPAQ